VNEHHPSGVNHPRWVMTSRPTPEDDHRAMPEATYEIRIKGRVSQALLDSFAGMDSDLEPVETVLHGPIKDQAELHGVIDRIQALGLELIEVRRVQR